MMAYFTRDSVAAGDDADAPHARDIYVPDDVTVIDLVQLVWREGRLPSISGGQATWALTSIVPLAVGAQQWPEPRVLRSFAPGWAELDVKGGTVRLHFSYFAQRDPEVVFDVLRRLRVRAEG